MVRNTLSAVIVSLVFISGAAAESLSLDRAIETAIANNTDLQKTALAYQQAKRAKDYGWNQFLPSISGPSVGLSHTHRIYPPESDAAGSSGGGSGWSWSSVSIGAGITFTTDIPTQFRLLDNKYKQAEEAYKKAERDLSASVASSFYLLLSEKIGIDILTTDMELKKAQYDEAEANYRRGLASELDMLNAQYAYLIAGTSLENAVNKYSEDLAAFFLLIGLDVKSDLEPEGTIEIRLLDIPPAEELIGRYLLSRSDIQTQIHTLEQTKLNASSRIRQAAPSLSVSERLNLSPGSFKFEDPSVSGTFSLSVSIPLDPWIPGSAQSLNRKNDRDSVALAETALEAAKKNAAQDIQKKANAVVQNAANIEPSELNYRIAMRAYELTEQGYRSGMVNQTELQSANQKRVSAEQAAMTTKIAYLTAVYNLALALNLDITEFYALYARDNIQ
ncbi:MAG: TolC family protein [Treponema sp.]|jgi:multidrug efflux system outer membrane protein|nr:TolC family protein [Treponema sp.]